METDADMKASAYAKKRARPKTKVAKPKTKTTESQSTTAKQLKFVQAGMQPGTKRIPPETWEKWKDHIVRKYSDDYEGKTLEQARNEMEKEHGFVAG